MFRGKKNVIIVYLRDRLGELAVCVSKKFLRAARGLWFSPLDRLLRRGGGSGLWCLDDLPLLSPLSCSLM